MLKIGSYNICHCGDYTNRKDTDPVWVQTINVQAMADAIKRLDFDVIGLNEVYFTGVNEDSFDQAKKLADLAVKDSTQLKKLYDEALPQLKLQMKALIARDLWEMNEYFRIMNEEDESVKKALELLKK